MIYTNKQIQKKNEVDLKINVDCHIKYVLFKNHPYIFHDKILNSLWIISKLRRSTVFPFPQLWLKFQKDPSINKG